MHTHTHMHTYTHNTCAVSANTLAYVNTWNRMPLYFQRVKQRRMYVSTSSPNGCLSVNKGTENESRCAERNKHGQMCPAPRQIRGKKRGHQRVCRFFRAKTNRLPYWSSEAEDARFARGGRQPVMRHQTKFKLHSPLARVILHGTVANLLHVSSFEVA